MVRSLLHVHTLKHQLVRQTSIHKLIWPLANGHHHIAFDGQHKPISQKWFQLKRIFFFLFWIKLGDQFRTFINIDDDDDDTHSHTQPLSYSSLIIIILLYIMIICRTNDDLYCSKKLVPSSWKISLRIEHTHIHTATANSLLCVVDTEIYIL